MSFNYRQNGSWNSPTVKHRENGQWVEVAGGGGGDGGDGGSSIDDTRFYTSGPPDRFRSGGTITYPSDGHSSIQAAYNDLSSNQTLVIEAGSYSERLNMWENPVDNITITGEGDRDTTIIYPDTNYQHTIRAENGFLSHSQDATLDAPVSGGGPSGTPTTGDIGDDRITVSTTSPFSVGDDIHIFEDRQPFGHSKRPGSDVTQEYNTITDIDGSDLLLETEVFLNYPNTDPTAVGVMDWFATDVRITNLDLEGNGSLSPSSDSRLLKPYGVKYLWIDDITCRDSGGRQQAFAVNNYKLRADQMDFRNVARYGWSVIRVSTHTMFSDINHHGGGSSARYAVRFGSAGSAPGSVDGYVKGAYGNLGDTPVVNCHYGGWWAHFEDIHSEDNTDCVRVRSHHLSADTLTETNTDGKTVILQNQWPIDIHVDAGGVDGSLNKSDSYVFYLNAGDDRNDGLDSYARDVTFQNFEIPAYNNSYTSKSGANQIGYFASSGADFRGDLIFRDVFYDGTKITESNVENWENYGAASIENLVVE